VRRNRIAAALSGVALGGSLFFWISTVRARPRELWLLLDLGVYRAGGALVHHGGAGLYDQGFGPVHLPFLYPPFAAATFAVASVLSESTFKLAFTTASVVALVVSVWVAFGMLGWRANAPRVAATGVVSAVALWLEPVQQTLLFGQVNLILMALVLIDLSRRDSRPTKGVLVGLATAFKLTPGIFIAYLAATGRRRPAVVALATFAATVAATWAVLPAESHRYWLGGAVFVGNKVGVVYMANQSLRAMLERLVGENALATALWLVSALTVFAVGLLAARSIKRRQELGAVLLVALVGLLVSPISWTHHYVWVAPALCLCVHAIVRAGDAVRRAQLAAATVAGAVLLFAWFTRLDPFGRLDHRAPLLPNGLIWFVRHAGAEMQWSTREWIGGDAYALAGIAVVIVAGWWALAAARQAQDFSGLIAGRDLATGGVARGDRLADQFDVRGRAVGTVELEPEMEMAAALDGERADFAGHHVAADRGDGPRQVGAVEQLEVRGERGRGGRQTER
jgi:alpha-1,2-mannosyltransferase